MKRSIYAALLVLALALPGLARQGGPFGVGVQLGEPSGLSAKYWLNSVNALDFLVGLSPFHEHAFIKADYLWHNFNLIRLPSGQMPLYFGMGAMVNLSHRPGVGLEGVVGLEYLIPSAPLDVYLDIAPGAIIVPETYGNVNAGIGMRWFF
jgi:hypothetical protein